MQTEMKTQLSLERIFHYQNRCVRTLVRDGEPWFVAADVCAILGLANPSQAVSYLDDDERCLINRVFFIIRFLTKMPNSTQPTPLFPMLTATKA